MTRTANRLRKSYDNKAAAELRLYSQTANEQASPKLPERIMLQEQTRVGEERSGTRKLKVPHYGVQASTSASPASASLQSGNCCSLIESRVSTFGSSGLL